MKTHVTERLPRMTIADAASRLRDGTRSSVDLVTASLQAIAAFDSDTHAFIRVDAREAQESARRADADLAAGRDRGPLHGIPISLKDLIDVAGQPTTAASRVLADSMARGRRADSDAPAPGRRRPPWQDEPARVRARHDQRGLGVRCRASPAGPHALGGRLERRLRGGGGHGHGPGVDRQRYRRINSNPVLLLWSRRAQAGSRRSADGRRRLAERLARPHRPPRAHSPGRGLALGGADRSPDDHPGRHSSANIAAAKCQQILQS